jgi:hypothetical protein
MLLYHSLLIKAEVCLENSNELFILVIESKVWLKSWSFVK